MKSRLRIKLLPTSTMIWLLLRKKLTPLRVLLRLRRKRMRMQEKSRPSLRMKSKNWHTSSRKLMMNMKSLRKITRMLSMREIFLELNSSEEMMSSPYFMRRLRFFSQLLLREKFSTKRDLKTSDFWSSRLLTWNLNSESSNPRLLKLETWERRSITFNSNS